MIASIRKLDSWGRELWRTTATHGADIAIDFDCEEDARNCVISACRRNSAWPLTIDTYYEPGKLSKSEIFGQEPPSQRVLVEGLKCLPGQLDLF